MQTICSIVKNIRHIVELSQDREFESHYFARRDIPFVNYGSAGPIQRAHQMYDSSVLIAFRGKIVSSCTLIGDMCSWPAALVAEETIEYHFQNHQKRRISKRQTTPPNLILCCTETICIIILLE